MIDVTLESRKDPELSIQPVINKSDKFLQQKC